MADDAPKDVKPPDLKQPMMNEPSVTGDPRVGDNPARNPRGRRGKAVPDVVVPPPSHADYAVSPGSVNDAGNEILTDDHKALDTYERLKATVDSTKSWIFWAPTAHGLGSDNPNQPGWDHYVNDKHPEVSAQLGAAEDNLLLEIADTITLAGTFADQIDNAAQFYTQADKSSALPDSTRLTYAKRVPLGDTGTKIRADLPKDDGADPAQGG